MSNQFKSVEPRLAPPSRGQHAGAVVLDVLHRRNSVIIRSKRPSGQAGASLALRALRKRKSAARRVGRAALAPHRAPGAQAVRVICFSCGRTRPETICQAPVGSRREAGRDRKPWRGPSHSSSSWRRRVGVARGTRRDRTARAPRSRSRCSRRPHRLRAGAPRPDAPVPNMPARRRAAGHARRVGSAPQPFARVSRKRCAPR